MYIWIKQVRMYYRSGTDGRRYTGAGRRFVFTHQVAALCCGKWRHGQNLECDVKLKIRLSPLMCINLNIPAKFNPDPNWNDGALGYIWRGCPQQEQRCVAIWDQFLIENNNRWYRRYVKPYGCPQHKFGQCTILYSAVKLRVNQLAVIVAATNLKHCINDHSHIT